jgi:adenylate cyclase
MLKGWHGQEISLDELLTTTAKALALDPNLAEAHASRGMALATSGKREEATAAFEQALGIAPDLYEANYFYGRFCMAQRRFDKAIALFVHAADIQPDDYRSPLHLQNLLRSLGRHEDGVKYGRIGIERAEQVLRAHPESSDPAQLGACGLAGLGEYDRAREWMARALAIDPDDNQARYNAACVCSLVGDADRAIEILESYLKSAGRDMKLWFESDSDLDAIRTHPRYTRLLELIRQ